MMPTPSRLVIVVRDRADEAARVIASQGFLVTRRGNELIVEQSDATLQWWWLAVVGAVLGVGIPISLYYLSNENDQYLVGGIVVGIVAISALVAVATVLK